jgi:hypothetical protein
MLESGPASIGSNFREKLEAKALLLRLNNLESAAVRSETSPVEAWRKRHAEAYRKIVGVLPADRQELQAAAAAIAAGQTGSVAAVIAAINEQRATETENPAADQPHQVAGDDGHS